MRRPHLLLLPLLCIATSAPAQLAPPATRRTMEELDAAIARNPKDSAAHAQLAAEHLAREDLPAARAAADRALALDPKNPLALNTRALCKLNANDTPGAKADYAACLQADPDNINAHMGLADLARRGKDPATAKTHYRAVLALDPASFPAAFYLGTLLMTEKDEAGAVALFEQALKSNPDLRPARQNLAQARQNLGHHEQALEQFTLLLKDEPDDWRYLAKVVQLNTALKRPEQAAVARAAVLKIAEAGQVENARQFCCEQFAVGDTKVLAFESFKLTPPENVRFSFQILRPTDGPKHERIDYGSSDRTTDISRELKDIGPNERIHNLDGYPAAGGHVTWYLEPKDLSYEEVRTRIVDIIQGKAHALSSSSPGLPQATQPAAK